MALRTACAVRTLSSRLGGMSLPSPSVRRTAARRAHAASVGAAGPRCDAAPSQCAAMSTVAAPASATAVSVPTSLTSSVLLSTGARMPMVGLGTWRAAPGDVGAAVDAALQAGYRHIDNAPVYQNEVEVGAAINQWLMRSGQKRESLFVTSKLWNTSHHPSHVESALRLTLSRLGLEYLDLYLIHWPVCFLHSVDEATGEVTHYPKTKRGVPLFAEEDVPIESTWEAMLACQRAGLVRTIGVSNFTSAQVLALTERFGADGPAVNQIEAHPFCAQHDMQRRLESAGVHVAAYSPLGNFFASTPPKKSSRQPPPPASPLLHETIADIASSHGVTPAQVLLRWNLQLGRTVLPKSVRVDRIRENAEIFHFQLTDEQLARIAQLAQPPTQHRFFNPTSFKRTPRKYFFTEFE